MYYKEFTTNFEVDLEDAHFQLCGGPWMLTSLAAQGTLLTTDSWPLSTDRRVGKWAQCFGKRIHYALEPSVCTNQLRSVFPWYGTEVRVISLWQNYHKAPGIKCQAWNEPTGYLAPFFPGRFSRAVVRYNHRKGKAQTAIFFHHSFFSGAMERSDCAL